jgi:hypothetical protein
MSHLGAFVPSKYFAFIYVRVYTWKIPRPLTASFTTSSASVKSSSSVAILFRSLRYAIAGQAVNGKSRRCPHLSTRKLE